MPGVKDGRLPLPGAGRESTYMKISDERLDDFTTRWRKAFGEELARQDAYAVATQLLELARILLRPISPDGQRRLDDLREYQPALTPKRTAFFE